MVEGGEPSMEEAAALNIKNPETQQLARQLVELTGETVTAAVTVAVRERLDQLRGGKRGSTHEERIEPLAMLAGHRPRLTGEFPERDHGDLRYDEAGLPV
ncbi:hypothetical protein GCM10027300_16350 [Modestobacter lapidis]